MPTEVGWKQKCHDLFPAFHTFRSHFVNNPTFHSLKHRSVGGRSAELSSKCRKTSAKACAGKFISWESQVIVDNILSASPAEIERKSSLIAGVGCGTPVEE